MSEKQRSGAAGDSPDLPPQVYSHPMNLRTELGRRRWIRLARKVLPPDRFASWLLGFEARHPPIASEMGGVPAGVALDAPPPVP